SRTRDEITESFPELPPVLAGLPQNAILDGEIVAWEYPKLATDAIVDEAAKPPLLAKTEGNGTPASEESEERADNLGRARPFSFLQQRLGRKKVSEKMLRENPVAYLVFDVLYADGELMIERPLEQRARMLDALLAAPRKSTQHVGHRGTQANLAFEE